MAQIRALVKNTDPSTVSKKKVKKSAKKPRLSLVHTTQDTPVQRPPIHSPTTRAQLTLLAEQGEKFKKQLAAQEAAVLADSVSKYFFYSALLDSRLFTGNEGRQI